MKSNVIRLKRHNVRLQRPRTFTEPERVIEYLAERIITDGRPYRLIAADIGVSTSTLANIARRYTKWPRPFTFFAVLNYYNVRMELK